MKNHSAIHRINRAQILDDSLTLARASLLEYPVALGTTEYLFKEFDYIPWKAAIDKFIYIDQMLSGKEGYESYREFMIRQLLPLYRHLGIEQKEFDKSFDLKLRDEVVQMMCDLSLEDCHNNAAAVFAKWNNPRRSRGNLLFSQVLNLKRKHSLSLK